MSRPRKRNLSRARDSWAWRLHLWAGLVAAGVLMVIAATGVLLNHTETLALDERFVSSDRLHRWYGLPEPEIRVSRAVESGLVAQVEDRLYAADRSYPSDGTLLGAVSLPDASLLIATDERLLLLQSSGDLIDELPLPSLQSAKPAAAFFDASDTIYIVAADRTFSTSTEFTGWKEETTLPTGLRQLTTRAAEPGEAREIRPRYYARALSVERVLLDLHSGRLFGAFGVLLFDLAALVLVLQVVTGLMLWRR